MRVAVTGISGFVGQALRSFFEQRGDSVVGLRIRANTALEEIIEQLEGCEAVINLSGANILARWSEAYKRTLYSSRIDTTHKLVEALRHCRHRPGLLLSASAVGIYPSDMEVNEFTGRYSEDFLGKLCQDWEAEANEAARLGMRVAVMRFGVIYGKGGGAMAKMLLPFKLCVGGKLGSGEQMVSWIHITDLIRAMLYIIEHETLKGVFNFTAPYPVSNREQTLLLAEAVHRPAFMKVPAFAIRLLFGEGATVVLDSKEVYPKALQEAGFEFAYPTLDTALADIVSARAR